MGQQFSSIAAAARSLNVSTSTISRRLKTHAFTRDAEGRIQIPDDAHILLRGRVLPLSDKYPNDTPEIRHLPIDMSQIEQANALLGVLDAELRRRDADNRRRDDLLRQALAVMTKLVDRLPPSSREETHEANVGRPG